MNHSRNSDSEVLVYIEKMLGELSTLAKGARCSLLAYMIAMASQEAHDRIEAGQKAGEGRRDRLHGKFRNVFMAGGIAT